MTISQGVSSAAFRQPSWREMKSIEVTNSPSSARANCAGSDPKEARFTTRSSSANLLGSQGPLDLPAALHRDAFDQHLSGEGGDARDLDQLCRLKTIDDVTWSYGLVNSHGPVRHVLLRQGHRLSKLSIRCNRATK